MRRAERANATRWIRWIVVLAMAVCWAGLPALNAQPPKEDAAVSRLLAMLRSQDRETRYSASGKLADAAKDAVPQLIAALAKPLDEQEQFLSYDKPSYWIVEALVKLGPVARPHLLAALEDENELVRAQSAEALGRIGDAAVAEKLAALLDDKAPLVRGRAALAIGRIGGPGAARRLLPITKDPSTLAQSLALDGIRLALTKAPDGEVLAPLLSLLEEQEYTQTGGVLMALGALKDPQAVAPIIVFQKARPLAAPAQVAWTLGEIGDPHGIPALIEMLDATHDYTRTAAVRGLLHFRSDERVAQAIARLLKSQEPDTKVTRTVAIADLAQCGEWAAPLLAEALTHPDEETRRAAEAALVRIYGEEFKRGGREWLLWKREQLVEERKADEGDKEARPRASLKRETEFALPNQVQVLKLLVAGDRIIASVRCQTPRAAGVPGDDRPWAVVASHCAAWDLEGKLLWRVDAPSAYHMVMAGGKIVIAHDDGSPRGERGLIWIDPVGGRIVRRAELSGRPASLVYNAHSETLLMVVYPPRRLETLDGAWMEVQSIRLDGTTAWVHKQPTSELQGLRLDGPAVVVLASHAPDPTTTALDAISGKVLWQARFGQFPRVPKMADRPDSRAGLVCIPKHFGLEFVEPQTGEVVHLIDKPADTGLPLHFCAHDDRVYFQSMTSLEGITLAAYDFASGKVRWMDETGSVCYRSPVAWGDDTLFFCRRYSEGLTGQVTRTEMRLYSPAGRVLVLDRRESGGASPHFDDTVASAVAKGRLYLVEGNRIVAYSRPGAK